MGITFKDYLENVYELIFTPFEFFKREDIEISVRQAAGTIIWVSLFTIIGQGIADKSINDYFFGISMFFMVASIVIMWLLTGLFFEYIAKIYAKDAGLPKILFFTSFATIPYIFFAPLNILKQSSAIGFTVGAIAQMFIYLWVITLYALAVKKAYEITTARAFMLIFLPFIGTFFAISWGIGFCLKMGYINSI